MKHKKPDERELAAQDPQYRPPPYEDLSSLVAGRIQAGPQSTPPRAGTCTNSDVVKFAEAIEKLQSDMDLRMRMGKLNKEKSSEFDISRVNGIMHKLYDDL